MSYKICFFSGNRSEFGLLLPIIKRLKANKNFKIWLIISGSHLSETFGNSVEEIKASGIVPDYEIPILLNQSTITERISSISELISRAGDILAKLNPSYVFILGDRYESYAFAISAFFLHIPIAHMGGGTITQGGCEDDVIRHSISQLSSIHFVTCEENKINLLSKGFTEESIVVSGSTAKENILNLGSVSDKEIKSAIGIDPAMPFFLVTLHPIPRKSAGTKHETIECLSALENIGCHVVITFPNADPGSNDIISQYDKWTKNPLFHIHSNLGHKMYLSLMRRCTAVVGNSSSIILESPLFKVPAINIGDRQMGRLQSTNVINVPFERKSIENALQRCLTDKDFLMQVRNCKYLFGDGFASNIVEKTFSTILPSP